VRHVHPKDGALVLELSDGTREPWDPARSRIGKGGAVYASVKSGLPGGPFEAKFTRFAQTELAPLLVDVGGKPAIRLGGQLVTLGGPEAPPE
jgi:hypothetical protein